MQALDLVRPRCGPRCCWRARRQALTRVRCSAADPKSVQPKGVVITGGSKGLGYAMAREFLQAGDAVVICGRGAERLRAAGDALSAEFPGGRLSWVPCDVAVAAQVDALAAFASERLGTVHLWINNAGQVTSKQLLADVPSDEIQAAVGSNVLGSLLGSRAAVRLMRAQAQAQPLAQEGGPHCHILNLGFSSWGAAFSKTAVTHKMTKRSLTQLTLSLAEELQQAGLSGVIGVHNLSPGLVLTDLLLQGASPAARRFFNVLADEPEAAAAALVPRLRALRGARGSVELLSPGAALARVAAGLPQILAGGRFFDKDGRRVEQDGARYKSNGVKVPFEFPVESY